MLLIIAISMFCALLEQYCFLFIQQWAQNFEPGQEANKKLFIYLGLSLGYTCWDTIRSGINFAIGYNTSMKKHAKMVFMIIHAEIEKFLLRISSGQIINRFSKDLSVIDDFMIVKMSLVVGYLCQCLAMLFFITFTLGWVAALPILLLIALGFYNQNRYMYAKREFVRLESMSKTPVMDQLYDVVNGLTSIRAFKNIEFFRERFVILLNDNFKNSLVKMGLDCWIQVRYAILSALLLQTPSFLYIFFVKPDLEPSSIGFFIFAVGFLSQKFLALFKEISDTEMVVIAHERCDFFEQIPHEFGYKNFEKEAKKYISGTPAVVRRMKKKIENFEPEHKITQAQVTFENCTVKYLTKKEPVLRKVNFEVNSGEKVGVIGRTGSGKSTLIKLLWNFMYAHEGQVFIDNFDIKEMDNKALRQQICTVTQDSALFQGTLMENLDPTASADLIPQAEEVLQKFGFENKKFLSEGVKMMIDIDGKNLSQGEKQVISLARIAINPKKLIILDEATASVDLKTEEAIQEFLETRFDGSTMLIIAHRIQTIMKCDRILVLADGEVVDYDSPSNLLKKEDSLFKQIYEKME